MKEIPPQTHQKYSYLSPQQSSPKRSSLKHPFIYLPRDVAIWAGLGGGSLTEEERCISKMSPRPWPRPEPALGCVSGGYRLGIGSPRASDGSVTPRGGGWVPSIAGKHRSLPGASSTTVFFKNLVFLV